ncbi:MAG: Zn-dependent hydrolase [Chloroflexota bacterium]
MSQTEMVQINGTRFWESIYEMAKIGATARGGVKRLAFSDLDYVGRDLFIEQCEELNMSISRDAIGNIFATMRGQDPTLPLVRVGSHLDSQPTGGKYDGALGVLAALEIARSIYESGKRPLRTLQIINFANEEGARFSPPMMGSGVLSGKLDLETMLNTVDQDGITAREAIKADKTGQYPLLEPHPVHSFFELHIEQGPILEEEAIDIGIVTGAQAQRWYTLDIFGQESHAGPTPMPHRKDALAGAAEFTLAVEQIARQHAPDGRGTVGTITIPNASPNVVPGTVRLTIDTRHPSDEKLLEMKAQLETTAVSIASQRKLEFHLSQLWHSPATPFDEHLQQRLTHFANKRGYSSRLIWSGAGHDAVYMAAMGVPTVMLFVPTKDGISHNESESIKQSDAIAGCQILCDAVVEQLM